MIVLGWTKNPRLDSTLCVCTFEETELEAEYCEKKFHDLKGTRFGIFKIPICVNQFLPISVLRSANHFPFLSLNEEEKGGLNYIFDSQLWLHIKTTWKIFENYLCSSLGS